jgi:RNA polymerase sigma factor (sigma-70 family)
MLPDKEFENRLVLHQQYLLNYAKILTKTARDYPAEDLLQDTNLRALLNKHHYRVDDSISGWLCFMMHNIFINKVIEKKLPIYYEYEDSDQLPIVERYSSSSSINDGENNMTLDLIDEAVNQLKGRDRDIVRRCISGESQADVGRSYGMKYNAVKQRYFHAVRIVREYLLEKGVEFNTFIPDSIKETKEEYKKKQDYVKVSVRHKLNKEKKQNNDD